MTSPLPSGSLGLRVLLVEQDPATAAAVRAALAGARSEVVHVAASADEAATARRNLSPDVVLWDTRLGQATRTPRQRDAIDVPVVPLLVDPTSPIHPDDSVFGHVSWPCAPELAVDTLREATCRHALARADAVQLQAAGMAHDVHTLLTVVNGCVGLALEDASVGPDTRRLLAEVLATGERATTLTKQLLSPERGTDAAPAHVDLAAVLRASQGLLQRLIGDRVELRLEAPATPNWVAASPSQLERLLSNLAVNAREAMPGGGVLTMSVSRLEGDSTVPEVTLRKRGPHARLRVSDTGTGIAPLVKTRMFHPHVTSKAAGTGLGLAIVDGIVEQLGGAIRVESAAGHGTTFDVFLPISAVREAETERTSQVEERPATILLVEDDEALCDLLATALRIRGYHVVEARNAADAVARFGESRRVHLMVTDVSIPDGPGPHLAAVLRARDSSLRVLYISGRFPQSCGIAEDRAFLQKPFALATFVERVRDLLES